MAGRVLAGAFFLFLSLAPTTEAHAYHHHHALRQRSEYMRAEHARAIGAPYVKPSESNIDSKRDLSYIRRSPKEEEFKRTVNLGLRRSYDEKRQLRDVLVRTLARPSSIERRQYTTLDLDQENEELQTGLDELNSAFEQLYDILAKDLPVCLGTSISVPTFSATPTQMPSALITSYSTQSVYASSAPGSLPGTGSSLIDGNTYGTSAVTNTRTTSAQPSSISGYSNSSTALASNPTSTSLAGTYTATTASASASASSSTNPSSYTFDPMSTSNVAVYYGQSNITNSVRLSTICEDTSVDIVVLAFITEFDTGSGYPELNLGGSGCWAATTAQTEAGASGLIDCTENVAPQIEYCQSLGKPVLLSIGGALSSVNIASQADALTYADTLWRLFGEGTGNETIRPFGEVTVDGFDIDNESGYYTNWPFFISALRTLASRASKAMYISAAPQCPRPDASIPLSSMQSAVDFVWVQFYNNPSCSLRAGSDFLSSVSAWSSDISTTTATSSGESFVQIGNGVTSPRLYVGAPSFYEGGEDAYTPAADLRAIFDQVRQLGLDNLGGGMLWNGEWGENNIDANGNSFVSIFKQDLV